MAPAVPQFPDNIASNVNKLMAELKNMDGSSVRAKTTTAALSASVSAYYKNAEKAKKPTLDLAKVMPLLEKGSKGAMTAIGKLADKFASSMDVMSESQKKAFDEMLGAMKAAEGGTDAKKMTSDQLILSEKKRKMEVENYRDGLQMEVLKGKALQTSGKGIQRVFNLGEGAIQGMWNKAKLAKSSVVEGVGGALGLTSETMAAITGPLVILVGAFMAMNSVSKALAENVNNAAKAGFNLGDSIMDAIVTGEEYEMSLKDRKSVV